MNIELWQNLNEIFGKTQNEIKILNTYVTYIYFFKY